MSKIKIFALGGLNEEGKNMYVVKVDRDIFIFDAGLKYASDRLKNDIDVGLAAINQNKKSYEFLTESLKQNKKILEKFNG